MLIKRHFQVEVHRGDFLPWWLPKQGILGGQPIRQIRGSLSNLRRSILVNKRVVSVDFVDWATLLEDSTRALGEVTILTRWHA